ncbi:hypothetical protein KIPB_003376 [Kipferlia bialata]|uniref:Uncharacterized protein n=1 Tax=Kipferlia bialata TaxID=797122 RepID=A0A9K3GHE0_9EUKA|nr:hypothetical protein KIPB_003376 [Kipferlia bialata]|eukprot:g3376.t1
MHTLSVCLALACVLACCVCAFNDAGPCIHALADGELKKGDAVIVNPDGTVSSVQGSDPGYDSVETDIKPKTKAGSTSAYHFNAAYSECLDMHVVTFYDGSYTEAFMINSTSPIEWYTPTISSPVDRDISTLTVVPNSAEFILAYCSDFSTSNHCAATVLTTGYTHDVYHSAQTFFGDENVPVYSLSSCSDTYSDTNPLAYTVEGSEPGLYSIHVLTSRAMGPDTIEFGSRSVIDDATHDADSVQISVTSDGTLCVSFIDTDGYAGVVIGEVMFDWSVALYTGVQQIGITPFSDMSVTATNTGLVVCGVTSNHSPSCSPCRVDTDSHHVITGQWQSMSLYTDGGDKLVVDAVDVAWDSVSSTVLLLGTGYHGLVHMGISRLGLIEDAGTRVSFSESETYYTVEDSDRQIQQILGEGGLGSQLILIDPIPTDGTGSAYPLTAVTYTHESTNLTKSNLVGMADGNYSHGQLVTVNTIGATNDGQWALTAGERYCVTESGDLSVISDDTYTGDRDSLCVETGRAITSNQMLITL